MRERPTVAVFDHSLYKEGPGRLTDTAQVVHLDQRGHGRTGRDGGEFLA